MARRLLDAHVYGEPVGSFRHFLSDLRAWQRAAEKRSRTKIKWSKLGKGFSEKQLGPPGRPFFKGKAAESRHALGYVVEKLNANVHAVRGNLPAANQKPLHAYMQGCCRQPLSVAAPAACPAADHPQQETVVHS